MTLSPADLDGLAVRGIGADDAERQLALLRSPPAPTRVEAACSVEHGVARLTPDEIVSAETAWSEAAAAGRFSKFVPASGAATRMFAALVEAAAGNPSAEAEYFLLHLDRIPFGPELRELVPLDGPEAQRRTVQAVLAPAAEGGLGYNDCPKGAVVFHRYGDGGRTAFEEHLLEAADYLAAAGEPVRLHFTVAADRADAIAALLTEAATRLHDESGAIFDTALSSQDPSSDTLAIHLDGSPLRVGGALMLRPAGHGALLSNLEATGADLLYVRNIDNVVHADHQSPVTRWKRILGGRLAEIERLLADLRTDLSDDGCDTEAALAAVERVLALRAPTSAKSSRAQLTRWLRDRVERPLRVCGVVPNTGEPGGGPFWVTSEDGTLSGQIVEAAQLDRSDPEQAEHLQRATHFNPVDLVCSLRSGSALPLSRWVDPRTWFVTEKAIDGQPARVLERPGLWNGAMAGWNTAFVEVPGETFAPVKTVNDLLLPLHQPRI